MKTSLKTWLQPLALSALLLCATTGAQAASFSKIVVFGDSLSDTGNTRASLPLGSLPAVSVPAGYGDNGRFSNGILWHEVMAPQIGNAVATNSLNGGAGGAYNYNYAYGGARVDDAGGYSSGLLTQYDLYDTRVNGNSDSNALFVVWGGGNDMRDLVSSSNPFATINTKLNSLETMLLNLIGTGATNFLIPNLPDLGMIPENRSKASQASATSVSQAWNDGLREMLLDMSGLASFYYLDVFSAFNNIIDNPADYGFANTTGQCRSTSGGFFTPREISCANADRWVFWDAIHPTKAAHAVLGNAAADLLLNGSALHRVPAPASLLLALTAVALMGGLRGRKNAPKKNAELEGLAA